MSLIHLLIRLFISLLLNFESCLYILGTFQVVLVVKNRPANAGDIKDMASIPGPGISPGGGHGNPTTILAWKIPWTEEPDGLQSVVSKRVRYN